ncbi:NAD(P)/FAD-dependent oxidoreductase [Chamaesiphon minutus]|uniref:NADH:ubiquinone reductase (non-electrogenic) n=1 Tax=Chamaesiphon minutus (strain ATCC 27169 / PCC 6605) TaxID=1173020 RepID=K9UCZ7_CHAP6|nr:NAD(P)/FAD-dependent oxidoreductase [Chamaesiphon minutus]AFY92700.1 NADH dehydrogenase, FAD-containing subunit [Chamaesiphon minutus PCC 6605]
MTVQKFPVVIIGAGFGGLQAAQSLAQSGKEVLLIDRNNYHTFVPLLYQVATAQLEPEHIIYPARTIVRCDRRRHFLLAEVEQIDFAARTIKTDRAEIEYDFLIIATGSKSQYLGVPGAEEFAFSMRSIAQAVTLRNQILACFEAASIEVNPLRRQQLLTFVIIGGGATGAEVAGAFVELLRSRMRHEYPTLNLREVKLILVQSGDCLLSELPPKLGIYTQKYLQKLGVDVRLSTKIDRITPDAVYLQDRQVISTKTVIWTAGVDAAVPDLANDWERGTKNKLRVRPTLQSIEYANVYAIGDAAYVDRAGQTLSGVAPEALQQGVAVARNITRQLRGQLPQPFNYFNKGRLAIIGCHAGVGQIQGWKFTGFLAWIMWLGVHLVYLPGYRNRLFVLLTWLQTYLLGDRVVRSILPFSNRVDARSKSVVNQKIRVGTSE